MKKIIIVSLVLLCVSTFGQLNKVELTTEEIQYLGKPKNKGLFSNPKIEDYEENLNLNKTIYFYEILYNNQVIFRKSLSRWSIFQSGKFSRVSEPICFKNTLFQDSDRLRILESKQWSANEVDGVAFYCDYKYHPLQYDKSDFQKLVVVSPLEDIFDIKIYKLIKKLFRSKFLFYENFEPYQGK